MLSIITTVILDRSANWKIVGPSFSFGSDVKLSRRRRMAMCFDNVRREPPTPPTQNCDAVRQRVLRFANGRVAVVFPLPKSCKMSVFHVPSL